MARLDAELGRVLLPLVTPFHEDGSVDHETLAALAVMVVDRNLCDSIIVSGTTGEFISLSFEERRQILGTVREAIKGRVPLIAGTGAAYTGHAIELTAEAESLGYDAALVVAPYYLRPTEEGLYQHYLAVAQSTNLPILLYNIPLFTGVNITPGILARLVDIANIRAIKDEAGLNPLQATEYARVVPEDFAVYSGDDTMVLQVLSQGGVGVVSGGSAIIGQRMKEMISAYFRGDVAEAQRLHLEMYELFRAFNMNGRINTIPLLRDALSMTWRDVGAPRLPLVRGSEEEKEELARVLRHLDMLPASASRI
jgi:4-hydroxy-tetrahydrodipicolinate synthase